MKYINKENQLVIKSWCSEPEQGCIEQAENLAKLPFAFDHIALMPDTHQGYGMPIGGVLATKDVIIPNVVGVDIGCGMCAVKTSLTEIDIKSLKKIMGEIRKQIPVGFAHHQKPQDRNLMPIPCNGENNWSSKMPIIFREFNNAIQQIGTLGGGNHFIEIQKGSDGHIWIMIHSGSRNLGKQVADYYNKLAISLNEKWHSKVPKGWQLAFLPVDSQEGQSYIQEMNYCIDFAFYNRRLMMDRIIDIFQKEFTADLEFNINTEPMINIAHNYAQVENHFGRNVWVHRKGATLARQDTIGIIPGSQGTKSYIVRGKGNPDSFMSCSHGAGRKLGRKEAERVLNLEDEVKKMDEQGILHGIRGKYGLDEAPGAYKDIDIVMEEQKDLVDILVELKPLGVIKG